MEMILYVQETTGYFYTKIQNDRERYACKHIQFVKIYL